LSQRRPKFHFYLDENFPAPAGKFLKSLGHSIFYVTAKQKSLSDIILIRKAIKEKRIFISLDKDFKTNENLIGSIRRSKGVILIQSSDPYSEKIISILKRHLKEISERKLKGKICRISIDKISFE
jgi:predicted nuclease of predicted toxin-antitoxin system